MSTTKDFENAPIGATATDADGNRAMKTDLGEWCWVFQNGNYLDDELMERRGYTLDSFEPTSAREALDLAWGLAHEVKPGQVIPAGTRFMEVHNSVRKEYIAQNDVEISSKLAQFVRTLEPLPEPKPDWLDAPAVLATPGWGPDRGVWAPKSGGVWKCACCRDERHWSELRDVTPLYPKETEK